MPYFLLALSIVLSTGRNLFSKRLSSIRFGTRHFFLCQSLLFICGAAALVLFGGISFDGIAKITLVYAAIYGFLLIFAQWSYTVALSLGNASLCSTVYSLGFIFPTVSGALFWNESFSVLDLLGVICAITAIIISGLKTKAKTSSRKTNASLFIPLTVATFSSGGLGIVQKLQQSSDYAKQKPIFLLVAFLIATLLSLISALFAKSNEDTSFRYGKLAVASTVGLFFGCCNLLNTTLAGLLDTAIFFPTLNIGIILLTMLCGTVFLREKLTKKDILILCLGGAAILLLNLG